MTNLKNITLALILQICVLSVISAQYWPELKVDFVKNGETLANPLTGGFNKPQFSSADLNLDGIEDLYVFDKEGNVSMTFLNGGTPNTVDFHFEAAYAANFPDMKDWVLLRDFNNDGYQDIFTNSNIITDNNSTVFGMRVFRGYDDGGKLGFEEVQFTTGAFNLIYYEDDNGLFSNLKILAEDYPAITDFDGDGDLDILNFEIGGSVLFYYKNVAMERGLGLDSLHFVLEDDCWGGLYEGNLAECPELAAAPGECADPNLLQAGNIHAGSTVLALNLDGDGDMDLILGDLPFNKFVGLTNNGTVTNPWISESDCFFPSYNVPADLVIFPCPFWLDMDNDGLKDLVGSPYSTGLVENVDVVWWWKNTTTNDAPVFAFQQTDLLADNMIDQGFVSIPRFLDYNADGLQDLVVGNFTFFVPGGYRDSRLFLYLNTGTTTEPAYELADDDFLGLSSFSGNNNNSYLAPAIGDLDGDGDDDMLVGTFGGSLFYFENTAGPNNPMTFSAPEFPYLCVGAECIDPGQKSVPQIIDLNRDNLPDIVIGESNGNLNFYPNTGTATEPMFEWDEAVSPNDNFFGGLDVQLAPSITGAASPLFYDDEGEYVLLCGTEQRGIVRFDSIDGNLDGNFDWTVDFRVGELHEGESIHMDMADIDSDGYFDFVIGNDRGGLRMVTSDIPNPSVAVNDITSEANFLLAPNPADDWVYLSLKGQGSRDFEISAYNLLGQQQFSTIVNANLHRINTADWVPGIYFIVVTVGGRTASRKLVIN